MPITESIWVLLWTNTHFHPEVKNKNPLVSNKHAFDRGTRSQQNNSMTDIQYKFLQTKP